MSMLSFFLDLIFKKPFDENILASLHPAPAHRESFIFSLFDYKQQKVREIIRYLKKYNDRGFKQHLANAMCEHIIDYLAEQQSLGYFTNTLVIPVPISKKRLHERGFNQTEYLAQHIAKNINAEYASNIIIKNKQTKKQALVKNRKDRFQNIIGAFQVVENKKHLLKNRDVIIVDDLVTTGATIMEIRRVLLGDAAGKIIGLTIGH